MTAATERLRILRALVKARRQCESEMRTRRGLNALLYWSARRRSLDEAIAIVRGIEHDDA